MLDVFNSNAFSIVSLTDTINKLKFVPGYIGGLGLFSETSVATTTISIEEKNNVLSLIAPSPRGAPGTALDKGKRAMRSLNVPHFEVNDAVMAEEVQNIRAFGSEDQADTVMRLVAERLGIHSQSLESTMEYARVGAIKGTVTYADNTTLDLFGTFGVSQLAEINFNLGTATSGALRKSCASVIRIISNALDGVPFSGLMAICGDAFFDDLIANAEVRASYLQQQEAADLRSGYIANGMAFGSFNFGGITWVNYRGSVGGTGFVNTDKCHIFPMGVPGLFRTVYAPADYVETVNTLGQRLYSKQYGMPNGKGVNLDTQMNALNYCTRPGVLQLGKRV